MNIEKEYPDVVPPTKKAKAMVVKTVLHVLGKSMENVVKLDEEAKMEVAALPDGYQVQFEVSPRGPYMAVRKEGDGIKFLGMKKIDADLTLMFRTVDIAFQMLTAQVSFPAVYCQCGLGIRGDVSHSMIFYRFSNIVQFYLFPKLIAQKVLKRVDDMSLEKFKNRLVMYAKLVG